MADIKQDLLSLQYSTSFSLSGMEEANIDLQLSVAPLPHPLCPASSATVPVRR